MYESLDERRVKRRQTKIKQDWKNKRLHGQFIRDTENIANMIHGTVYTMVIEREKQNC